MDITGLFSTGGDGGSGGRGVICMYRGHCSKGMLNIGGCSSDCYVYRYVPDPGSGAPEEKGKDGQS